jgi:hypothetical protein
MSATLHAKFTPETIAIATVAVAVLSQPVNMVQKMTFGSACAHAFKLLVAAQNFQDERAALIAAGKVSE